MVTCKGCGTVHMGISKEKAIEAVKQMNDYLNTLTPEEFAESYRSKHATLAEYKCWCGCNAYRPSKPDEIPEGSTVGPVIWEPKN